MKIRRKLFLPTVPKGHTKVEGTIKGTKIKFTAWVRNDIKEYAEEMRERLSRIASGKKVNVKIGE